jgi:hypothetical protein
VRFGPSAVDIPVVRTVAAFRPLGITSPERWNPRGNARLIGES